MKLIIIIGLLYILYRALPTILDIINARMAVKNEQLKRETDMIKRKTEQIKAVKAGVGVLLQNHSASCGCIGPWLIEEKKKELIAAGMEPENADAFLEETVKKLNIDVDYEYERYHLPMFLKAEFRQHALLESMKDSFKRGVSREARIAFWLRCNPGKTEQDAQVAVISSELIRE